MPGMDGLELLAKNAGERNQGPSDDRYGIQ
jgi:hypothetical protein